jgi:hypothetical protein
MAASHAFVILLPRFPFPFFLESMESGYKLAFIGIEEKYAESLLVYDHSPYI